jgi:ubiquinone biosynthesis protein COQ4
MTPVTVSSPRSSAPRRVLGALRALRRAPSLENVFALGEAVNKGALARMSRHFEGDPDGRRVLAERPELNSSAVDFTALEALPDGTLGREYVRFLRDNGLSPDVFKAPALEDPRAAYLAQRLRQTHDLWHVLTGYTPDVVGEVLLQAFSFAQMGTPSSLLITVFGALREGARRPRFFARVLAAYWHGRRARLLLPVYWEQHWVDTVESLRASLACPRVAA